MKRRLTMQMREVYYLVLWIPSSMFRFPFAHQTGPATLCIIEDEVGFQSDPSENSNSSRGPELQSCVGMCYRLVMQLSRALLNFF
jgi:hypothetical protein